MYNQSTNYHNHGCANARSTPAMAAAHHVQPADGVLTRALLQLRLNACLAGTHQRDGGVNIAADDGVIKSQLGNSLRAARTNSSKNRWSWIIVVLCCILKSQSLNANPQNPAVSSLLPLPSLGLLLLLL